MNTLTTCSLKSGLNQSSKQEKQQNFWKLSRNGLYILHMDRVTGSLAKQVGQVLLLPHSTLMFLISCFFDFVLASLFLFISIIARETFESLDNIKVW
ncbi:hypothetical protein Patl1_16739 [Pistacia atlantica]|uniref:Uncharacterized protein n=1 Tax=Pistacia atlantica TaxID=434234 RepID=A0ACC1BAF6_9ROSI|nr:hypothetical protein Patl1_16739 [Pistacia atlantica]